MIQAIVFHKHLNIQLLREQTPISTDCQALLVSSKCFRDGF